MPTGPLGRALIKRADRSRLCTYFAVTATTYFYAIVARLIGQWLSERLGMSGKTSTRVSAVTANGRSQSRAQRRSDDPNTVVGYERVAADVKCLGRTVVIL